MLGTVLPYYITVVNQKQDVVRLEGEDHKRSWKKPRKMHEEVHTTVYNTVCDTKYYYILHRLGIRETAEREQGRKCN